MVGKLACFLANPLPAHFKAVDRVLLYINATKDLYLKYNPNQTNVNVDAFTNADWAQSKPDRKSTSGYLFYINGTAFSWSSKKQSTVATSTMEAEYIGLFHASQQAAWVKQFLAQTGHGLDHPIDIYCNSTAVLATAASENLHKLSKHLDIKLHSIHEQVENKVTKLKYTSTKDNTADILTKSLLVQLFRKHSSRLGLEPIDYDKEEEEVNKMLTPLLDEGNAPESETRGSVEV